MLCFLIIDTYLKMLNSKPNKKTFCCNICYILSCVVDLSLYRKSDVRL